MNIPVLSIISSSNPTGIGIDENDIANIFETSGAINYCRKIAAGYIQQSIDALNNLELTDPNFTHIFVNNIKEVFENS